MSDKWLFGIWAAITVLWAAGWYYFTGSWSWHMLWGVLIGFIVALVISWKTSDNDFRIN